MLKIELERADGSLSESFWARLRGAASACDDGTTKGAISATDPADANSRRPIRPGGDPSGLLVGVGGVQDQTTSGEMDISRHACRSTTRTVEKALCRGFAIVVSSVGRVILYGNYLRFKQTMKNWQVTYRTVKSKRFS
mmetsp:Transcript_10314/g.24590  ORF Transcript_10314/g.24590 Transcript_10314/m.24590 type:complete len:138 (-) Transcript_10314:60-473(-)